MSRATMTLGMAGAILGGVLIGCDDDPAAPVEEDPVAELVETIRGATQAYHDFDAAIAAGFEQASPCIEAPAGGMGFHYARVASVDATLDAADPEILLYEPIEGGGMRLVGVEFLVLSEPWDAANAGAPSLVDESFDDHRDPDLWHGLPFPHYEFHVWAWEENPSGLFTPFNPAVGC